MTITFLIPCYKCIIRENLFIQDWLVDERRRHWPTGEIVNQILQTGCHVVPKPSTNSILKLHTGIVFYQSIDYKIIIQIFLCNSVFFIIVDLLILPLIIHSFIHPIIILLIN